MRIHKAIIGILVLIFFLLTPSVTLADYFYGGPQAANQILVEKFVKDPGTGNFVNNLGPTDNKFSADQEIVFNLKVKNTGDQNLSNVSVRDIFPQFSDWVSGPDGASWDGGTKTLTFNVGNLTIGETKDFQVKGKITTRENLPSDKSLVCVSNFASVQADNVSDTATSGFCIQNARELPATGPSTLPIIGIGLIGVLGIYLIRKNSAV